MKIAAKLDKVTKNFRDFKLDEVTIEVPGGSILGLIGENGAGKTTALKCLLGLLRIDGGKVILPPGGLAQVGYVPDECPFFPTAGNAGTPSMTVRQTGECLAGMFPGWDRELFAQYLKKFDLPEKKKGKDLSRGMKMKLSIAAALAHRPKLLVLDEATSGLDPVVRDEILDELLDFISDEEHAIILSSHITSDLEKVCDYVAYLHKGRVTVSGPKDELLENYGKLSCTKADLEGIESGLLVGVRPGEYGCQALVRDRTAFERAHPQLQLDRPTLEDIMIFTTRGEKR